MEELLKLFKGKPELGHEVEVMWAREASAQEVADMLAGKGVKVEPAQVEKLLAAMQAKRAETIGDGEKVDTDQLKAVAGGLCMFWQTAQGMDGSCSNHFKDPHDCYYSGYTACTGQQYDVCLFGDLCDDIFNWYS